MQALVFLVSSPQTEVDSMAPHSDVTAFVRRLDLLGIDSIGLAFLWSILSGEPWLALEREISRPLWPTTPTEPWLLELCPRAVSAFAHMDAADPSVAHRWRQVLQEGWIMVDQTGSVESLLSSLQAWAQRAQTEGNSLYVWDNQRITE